MSDMSPAAPVLTTESLARVFRAIVAENADFRSRVDAICAAMRHVQSQSTITTALVIALASEGDGGKP